MALGLAQLVAAAFVQAPRRVIEAPPSWAEVRFGYGIYALSFLAFDMEMNFMYPWAVAFADIA
jgi:NADH:ubiquinone oxidoreductase subunit 3 (subunit A)